MCFNLLIFTAYLLIIDESGFPCGNNTLNAIKLISLILMCPKLHIINDENLSERNERFLNVTV